MKIIAFSTMSWGTTCHFIPVKEVDDSTHHFLKFSMGNLTNRLIPLGEKSSKPENATMQEVQFTEDQTKDFRECINITRLKLSEDPLTKLWTVSIK
jgi:hypothetical protein